MARTDILMMYDGNLSTYKVLNPSEKVEVNSKNCEAIEFYLSGETDSMVSVTGLDDEGNKNILYIGYAGYIKLPKSMFGNSEVLTVSTAGNLPVKIHQIVR